MNVGYCRCFPSLLFIENLVLKPKHMGTPSREVGPRLLDDNVGPRLTPLSGVEGWMTTWVPDFWMTTWVPDSPLSGVLSIS